MRIVLRTIARTAAAILVLPLVSAELVLRRVFERDVLFNAFAQWLSLVPGTAGSLVRNAYYHFLLQECPFGCTFSFGMVFTHSRARIGRRVYVGSFSMIGYADIGDETMIGDHVHVLSGAHQHGTASDGVPYQRQRAAFRTVTIGANVWIGCNAVIMNDIGKDCVIGASAVVTKPIPPGSLAVGNPARVLRSVYPEKTQGSAPQSSDSGWSRRR